MRSGWCALRLVLRRRIRRRSWNRLHERGMGRGYSRSLMDRDACTMALRPKAWLSSSSAAGGPGRRARALKCLPARASALEVVWATRARSELGAPRSSADTVDVTPGRCSEGAEFPLVSRANRLESAGQSDRVSFKLADLELESRIIFLRMRLRSLNLAIPMLKRAAPVKWRSFLPLMLMKLDRNCSSPDDTSQLATSWQLHSHTDKPFMALTESAVASWARTRAGRCAPQPTLTKSPLSMPRKVLRSIWWTRKFSVYCCSPMACSIRHMDCTSEGGFNSAILAFKMDWSSIVMDEMSAA
mmetsp:Transcript_29840/g.75038  ORF Transcript_29840/g.75038 Transcript_29840/m.75038 type:complete len:300 (+) Transcript_29840:569-1468(+)